MKRYFWLVLILTSCASTATKAERHAEAACHNHGGAFMIGYSSGQWLTICRDNYTSSGTM